MTRPPPKQAPVPIDDRAGAEEVPPRNRQHSTHDEQVDPLQAWFALGARANCCGRSSLSVAAIADQTAGTLLLILASLSLHREVSDAEVRR